MLSQQYLRSVYGPAAAFSEYQLGDVISYLKDGRKKFGIVLWVCAPRALGEQYTGIIYVVQTQNNGRPDLVSSANVLTLSKEDLG